MKPWLDFVADVRGLEPGPARVRAHALIAELGLAGRTDEPVHQFSHGMRKKLSFIAAILHRPPVLLCDEALEGFDASGALAAKQELRALAWSGAAVLFSSHVTETIERLCDRAVMLHRGRIVRLLERSAWGAPASGPSPREREFLIAVGVCTHLGCSPSGPYAGGSNAQLGTDPGFICPCHGSTFDLDSGKPRSLPAFVPVTRARERLVGKPDQLRLGMPGKAGRIMVAAHGRGAYHAGTEPSLRERPRLVPGRGEGPVPGCRALGFVVDCRSRNNAAAEAPCPTRSRSTARPLPSTPRPTRPSCGSCATFWT